MNQDFAIELIGPEQAGEYLKGSAKRNRKLIYYHLQELIGDMKAGRWRFNGDPIRFNQKNELIDGRHRMQAIVETGKRYKFLVVRALAEDAFETIDVGAKRSTRDYLSMDGHKYPNHLAAAVRYLVLLKKFGNFNSKEPITHGEKMEYFAKNPELSSFVEAYCGERLPIRISAALLTTLHLIFKEKSSGKAADEFMNGLVLGQDLHKDDPRLTARNWIQKRPIYETSWSRRDFTQRAANVIIHCWNLWRTGEKISSIKPIKTTPEISK